MIIGCILLVLSIATATLIEVLCRLYTTTWTIVIAILAIPLLYLVWFLVYLIILFIWSLFITRLL